MSITEAIENYLEIILILTEKQGDVRATDICSYTGYSRPTVSVALKGMKTNGLISVDRNNLITLTEHGLHIAKAMYDRHNTLAQALMYLGVAREIAYEDACKIEHDISEETFTCIKQFMLSKGEKN